MDVNQLFIDHDKWLRDLAFRNIGRLTKVGYGIDIDELYSIFCEVFMDCVTGRWDPAKGKLTTYLFYACNNKVSDMLDRFFRIEAHTKTESEFLSVNADGDDREVELFVQEDRGHLGEYELLQALSEQAESLSPFARLLLEYTLNPPEFIERELEAQEAKHELSLTMSDVTTYRRNFMSLSFVVKCIEKSLGDDMTHYQVMKAVKEVKAAVHAVTA